MKKLVLTFACAVSLSAAYAVTPEMTIRPLATQVSMADSANLADYVGKYKMEGLPFDYITIAVKDGKLMIDTGSQNGQLTPMPEVDKYDAAGQAAIKFVRNADKKVTGVTLEAQGMSFNGKKEA